MFEKIFSFPAVLRRDREGPLAPERLEYLKYLSDRGAALGTVLKQARYCLCVAHEIQRWPRDHFFNTADVEALAASWAARRVAQGRAAASRRPQEQFHSVACSFLNRLGRLAHDPDQPPGPYDALIEDFLEVQCRERGLALATRNKQHWHIRQFLFYLNQQSHSLEGLTPDHIDAYLTHLGQTWSRVSLSTTAGVLRAWLRHCEIRGRTCQVWPTQFSSPGSTGTRGSPWDRAGSRSEASSLTHGAISHFSSATAPSFFYSLFTGCARARFGAFDKSF